MSDDATYASIVRNATQTVIGIDPGEVHCGFAIVTTEHDGWHSRIAGERTPQELYSLVLECVLLPNVEWVVESFRLYPWKAQQQGFSQLRVVETIGVLRYLLGERMIEQSASIKKTANALLRARGMAPLAVTSGVGGHAKDAELHAWYRIMRTKTERQDG